MNREIPKRLYYCSKDTRLDDFFFPYWNLLHLGIQVLFALLKDKTIKTELKKRLQYSVASNAYMMK